MDSKIQTLMGPRHDEDGWPLGAPAPASPVPSHKAATSSDEGYANLVQQATLDLSAADAPGELIREQDRLLPAANIFRIMQRELPEGFKISRDAKYFMQEALSEFVCFVTSEVNDICLEQRRRTMVGEDFVSALVALDFNEWVEPLQIMLPHMAPKTQRPNKVAPVKRERHNGGAFTVAAAVAGEKLLGAEAANATYTFQVANKKMRHSSVAPPVEAEMVARQAPA